MRGDCIACDALLASEYDTYFHHDVKGHGAKVMLPRSMLMDFFCCNFPTDFSPFLSLLVFLYIAHLSHIFVLALLVHLDK